MTVSCRLFVFSIIAITLLFIKESAHSQTRDSLIKVYNTSTIRTFGNYYIKGDKQLSFMQLKPELQSQFTKGLYKKSKKDLIFSKFLTVTSITALVAGAAVPKTNKTAAWAFLIAGIALNFGSIYSRKQSRELLEQAIWQKNKEVLFGDH